MSKRNIGQEILEGIKSIKGVKPKNKRFIPIEDVEALVFENGYIEIIYRSEDYGWGKEQSNCERTERGEKGSSKQTKGRVSTSIDDQCVS